MLYFHKNLLDEKKLIMVASCAPFSHSAVFIPRACLLLHACMYFCVVRVIVIIGLSLSEKTITMSDQELSMNIYQ